MNEKIDQNLGRDRNEKKSFMATFSKMVQKPMLKKCQIYQKRRKCIYMNATTKIGWTVLYTFHSRILEQFDNE